MTLSRSVPRSHETAGKCFADAEESEVNVVKYIICCLVKIFQGKRGEQKMTETSNEALLMSLLEQIRSLEEDRDRAVKLANDLSRKNAVIGPTSLSSSAEFNITATQTLETMTGTVLAELEEIRLREEHRQNKLQELKEPQQKTSENNSDDIDLESCKTMLEMSKKYYGRLVSELQEERDSLQQKLTQQRNVLLEKDMKIAEMEMKLQHRK